MRDQLPLFCVAVHWEFQHRVLWRWCLEAFPEGLLACCQEGEHSLSCRGMQVLYDALRHRCTFVVDLCNDREHLCYLESLAPFGIAWFWCRSRCVLDVLPQRISDGEANSGVVVYYTSPVHVAFHLHLLKVIDDSEVQFRFSAPYPTEGVPPGGLGGG